MRDQVLLVMMIEMSERKVQRKVRYCEEIAMMAGPDLLTTFQDPKMLAPTFDYLTP